MKKFITLIATLVVCLTMGMATLATESPDAGEDVSGGHRDPSTEETTTRPGTSPVTGDTLVIPGLGTLAIAGIAVSTVAKKKMEEQ